MAPKKLNLQQEDSSNYEQNPPGYQETEDSPPANLASKGKQDPVAQSRHSNVSSLTSKFPHAREVNETFYTVLREMAIPLFSLVVNGGFGAFFAFLQYGLFIEMSVPGVEKYGPMLTFLMLLLANQLTIIAMNRGFAAYFGKKLASPSGYSLAVCGFLHFSSFIKLKFAFGLGKKHHLKSMLSGLSLVWIFAECIKILAIIPPSDLLANPLRMDHGTVNCIEYFQKGMSVDRKWPTMDTQAGYAELVFGTAIGNLRSEMDVSVSTAIMAPQIVGSVGDGDTIIGAGFLTDISTSCTCIELNHENLAPLVKNYGSETDFTENLLFNYKALNGQKGMASFIGENVVQGRVVITGILGNANICPIQNQEPVCSTILFNHRNAEVMVSYMTDGTPASIAAKYVVVRKVLDTPGRIDWVTDAMINIHDGIYSNKFLKGNVPTITSPLLWWTTPDLNTTKSELLEAGLETYYAILLRAGIQRTFRVKGNVCQRNIEIPGACTASMGQTGVSISLLVLAIQAILSLISIFAFFPWLFGRNPIGPAVQVVQEEVYFNANVNSVVKMREFQAARNSAAEAMWDKLDVVVRFGEASSTVLEAIGHITMSTPQNVSDIVNGRRYY